MQNRRPRTPWLRRIEQPPSALVVVRQRHQIPPDSRVVHLVYALALRRIVEYRSVPRHVRRPHRPPTRIHLLQKLPRTPLPHSILRHSRQHQPVVAFIRRRSILRIRVHKPVPRPPIVPPEIQKRRRPESRLHFEAPPPRLPTVLRPQQLRIPHIPHPQIQHPVHHQYPAGLGTLGAVSRPLRVRPQVHPAEIG